MSAVARADPADRGVLEVAIPAPAPPRTLGYQ
jgi:hypothetical protein